MNGAGSFVIRKTLQRYWKLTRSLTLGAQGIVVDDDNRVLLVRHSYRPGWHFPGGGVERGETVGEALARELREEANVVLSDEPELVGIYANFQAFPGDHVALFLCRVWAQPSPPTWSHEIVEHKFFALGALPPGAVEAVRLRVAEIFGDAPRSAVW